jgi:hypothetical protein
MAISVRVSLSAIPPKPQLVQVPADHWAGCKEGSGDAVAVRVTGDADTESSTSVPKTKK